jgi:hypothetical protein
MLQPLYNDYPAHPPCSAIIGNNFRTPKRLQKEQRLAENVPWSHGGLDVKVTERAKKSDEKCMEHVDPSIVFEQQLDSVKSNNSKSSYSQKRLPPLKLLSTSFSNTVMNGASYGVQHLEMIIVYILHFISLRFDKFRKSYA